MSFSNYRIRFSSTKCFELLLLYLWIYNTVVRYGSIFLGHVPYFGGFLQNYLPIVILILLAILSLNEMTRSIRKADLALFGIVLLVSLTTIIINSEYSEAFIYRYFSTFILMCFPMYFVGLSMVDYIKKDTMDKLYRLSVIAIYLSVFMTYRSGTTLVAEWSADMYLAYLMLPHALIAFLFLFFRITPLRVIHAVVSFVYMFMMGNRGSLACLLFFVVIAFIIKCFTVKSNRLIIMTVLLGVFTLVIIYTNLYDTILKWLYSFALSHNMSVRVILSFQSNSGVTLDSGRFSLYQQILKAIHDNILGYGPGADVYLIGHYSHNIFLEIAVDFGVLTLIVFVAFLIYKNIRFHKVNRNDSMKIMILWLLFSVSILKLCFSGTFYEDPYVFLYLGYCVGGCRFVRSYITSDSYNGYEVNRYDAFSDANYI